MWRRLQRTRRGDTVAPGATTRARSCQRLQAGEARRAQRRHEPAGPELLGHTKEEVDPDEISSGIEFDMANMIAPVVRSDDGVPQ